MKLTKNFEHQISQQMPEVYRAALLSILGSKQVRSMTMEQLLAEVGSNEKMKALFSQLTVQELVQAVGAQAGSSTEEVLGAVKADHWVSFQEIQAQVNGRASAVRYHLDRLVKIGRIKDNGQKGKARRFQLNDGSG